MTKIFCDIADINLIKKFNKKKIVKGFTTNPSLMRKTGAKDYTKYCKNILKITKKPISFEVFADDDKNIVKQALEIKNWGKQIYVKVPVTNSKGIFLGKAIKYLNNENIDHHQKNFLPWCLFTQLQKVLTNIDNIHAQESGLYSDKYKVAGRVDCIAEYDGVLSIIDFKTSTKERNDEWNENYYIQCSAYAEMYEERTGKEIKQIVILCVTEDGQVQEFIKEKYDYLDLLVETTEEWRNKNETSGSPIMADVVTVSAGVSNN